MVKPQLSESSVQGFPALTLANGLISLTMVPELGGKISSIRDLRTGREWLWTSDRLPYRRLPYGTSYIEEADTGGWDECFPTVAACSYPLPPWRGLSLPDHGELWPQTWKLEIDRGSDGTPSLRTEALGVALPYVFRRSVRLASDLATLRFEYGVRSTADADIAFIWSAHPLFLIEPGTRVLLPEGAIMRAYSSVPPALLSSDRTYRWPLYLSRDARELHMAQLPDRSAGVAFKLWSEPLAEGWTALEAPDGRFEFVFDPQQVPQVGLWVNAGGWSGAGGEPYYNLALEPCIGAQDSLEEAVERYHHAGILPAGETREWWLEVRLEA